MTHNALTPWLVLPFLLLIIFGVVRLVRGRTSLKAPQRRVAVLAIALGTIGWVSTSMLTRAGLGTSAQSPVPQDTVVSERSFESDGPLGVVIQAPDGWVVQFDSTAGILMLIKGASSVADAPAVLQVRSTFSSDEVNADRMLRIAGQKLEEQGLTVGKPFAQTIDGLPALGATADDAAENRCIWFVRRGPKYVSALTCLSRDSTSAREACRPVLERLRWRMPR